MMKRLALILLLLSDLAHAQPAPTLSSFVGSTGSTNVSNTITNYFSFVGIAGTYTDLTNDGAPNSPVVMVSHSASISFNVSHLCCFLGTAPGTGKSYTITPVADPTLFSNTVTISNSATTACDTTHTQTLGFGTSNIGYKVVPAGTPTATTVGCYIEATVN